MQKPSSDPVLTGATCFEVDAQFDVIWRRMRWWQRLWWLVVA